MWRCVSSRCRRSSAPPSSSTTSSSAAFASSAPSSSLSAGNALRVAELPAAPLAPLYLTCCACSTRMVACECCDVLLAVDREVDGVLLCTRCGFLTVLDANLRALVQIPPFSRAILTCVTPTPSVGELDRLKTEWMDWETRARLAQQRTSSEGNAANVGINTPPTHKRRRRPDEDAAAGMSPQSEPALPSTPTGRASMSAELKAEGKHLQAEIQRVRRQWHRLRDEAEAEATTRNLQSLQQPMFSSTHLHILKIMYEKAMERAELADLVARIDEFLLQQSTIVKTKYDLLAGVRSYQQVQQLPTIVSSSSRRDSLQQATTLMVHCAEEQVRYLRSQFDTSAREHLRLVGTANKHLFALYSAAQGLSRMHPTEPTARASISSSGSSASLSPFLLHENSRKRRLFGSSRGHTSSGDALVADATTVSRVQQDIEMRHRISEIAKKIEVWRGLSLMIASCCVPTLVELAQTHQQEQDA